MTMTTMMTRRNFDTNTKASRQMLRIRGRFQHETHSKNENYHRPRPRRVGWWFLLVVWLGWISTSGVQAAVDYDEFVALADGDDEDEKDDEQPRQDDEDDQHRPQNSEDNASLDPYMEALVRASTSRAVVCPRAATRVGYVSLTDLTDDILDEVERLQFDPSAKPLDSYRYRLCPHTIFYVNDTSRIVPLLNNSLFECADEDENGDTGGGADGSGTIDDKNEDGGDPSSSTTTTSSSPSCIVRGGTLQVLMADRPDLGIHRMERVSFRHIQFDMSQQYSIGAFASNLTVADFYNCHWKSGTGESAIHITYQPDFGIPEDRQDRIALVSGTTDGEEEERPNDAPPGDVLSSSSSSSSTGEEAEAPAGRHSDDVSLRDVGEYGERRYRRRRRMEKQHHKEEEQQRHQAERNLRRRQKQQHRHENAAPAWSQEQQQGFVDQESKPQRQQRSSPTSGRRSLQPDREEPFVESPNAMVVNLLDCSITSGYNDATSSGDHAGYRAIFNAGTLLMDNVTVQDNQGEILVNIVGGNALIVNSLFYRNDASALVRPIKWSVVEIRDSYFMENEVSSTIFVVDSEITMDSTGFLDNQLRDGDFFSFGSDVYISTLCIEGGSSSVPMFFDEGTYYEVADVFAEGHQANEYCGGEDGKSSSLGFWVEDDGADCFQDDADCRGECIKFDAASCGVEGLTIPPSPVPTVAPTPAPTNSPDVIVVDVTPPSAHTGSSGGGGDSPSDAVPSDTPAPTELNDLIPFTAFPTNPKTNESDDEDNKSNNPDQEPNPPTQQSSGGGATSSSSPSFTRRQFCHGFGKLVMSSPWTMTTTALLLLLQQQENVWAI